MAKINLNESLFEAVNSLGVERPDTYKKRQKPLSILAFDSLEKLGYNVFASREGNGYEISKRNEKNLQKAKDLCDTLNLDYVVKPFRDRYYMTINLPKEDDAVINSYFRSTDKAMAEKVTTKKGSNKLNKYLKEDDNTLSIQDKFNYLKSYPTYNSRSGSGKAYTRPCKVYDLGLTDEQREEFFKFLEDGGLEAFWNVHEYDSLNIYQEGRMGGHLILDPQIVDPYVFDEFDSYEEYLQDYLDSNYYPDLETPEGDLEYSSEQIENATSEVNSEISDAYDALVDFDNRVDALIRDLKGTLDLRINDSDIDNLNESINEVKNILQPLVTKDGKVRALKDDEKLPRGFRFKSGTSTSGEVKYKGTDYAYAVVNGKLKVMTSAEAGDNWSETIYKESIENAYQMFIETIEEYADEYDLDLDNLTKHNDIIPEAGDYYRAAVEDLISLGKKWEGYFGKISHTVLDDIKEMVKEKLGIGEILKKLKDNATEYLTESFTNDSLKYGRDAAKKFKNDFDVASPQETANMFGKNVNDNGKIYKPTIKEEFNQSEIDFIFSSKDEKYPYMMLSRLKSDCDYYLGAGNKADKHLWALNPKDQIAYMRAIYDRLEEKPEWLTSEQIDEYEKKMIDNSLTESTSDVSDLLDKAYNGSYYTIIGAGGDLQEWKDGYQELLNKENIGTIKEWITFTGSDMNTKYNLTGDNAYPNDLTFLAFPLDGLEIGKLAIFKIRMRDRWFDDIVDNNRRFNESYQSRLQKLNESFEDEHLGEITTTETTPETPAVGPELGIAGVINSLIIDEFEAIDGYNSAIATAEEEGMTDIVNVLKDIANEENLHVGQLQTCLTKVSPNAQSIDDGQVEAQQQLDNINQTQVTQEVTEAFDKKQAWLKEMAQDDWDAGHTFDPDDFHEFKKIAKECGFNVNEKDFDKYFEYLEDIRYKANNEEY